jgi:multiple sugar transport system permease protein
MAIPLTTGAGGSASRPGLIERIVDDERWLGRLLLAPAVTYIFVLVGVPFVLAVFYSFTNVTISSAESSFVGLATIIRSVEDPGFARALRNTFLFAIVSQGLVMVFANVLAVALQRDFRGKRLVRLLILLPWVAPVSLGSIGWLWIFDSIYSVINWTLRWIGYAGWPIWLGEPHLAMSAIITVHVWRTMPLATVILLGGLSSIPQDIHDAAEIDGAGFFRHLFQITLPLIRPIQLVALLFGLVFAFTDMIIVYVLTRGGPYDTTQVLASLAFFKGIDGGDLASGAATALFLLPVLAAAAILMLRLARRTEVT